MTPNQVEDQTSLVDESATPAALKSVRVGPEDCPSPHSRSNKLGRLVWGCVWLALFRTSPWFFHGWRRMLLRMFGARVGRNAKIFPSTKIWAPWNLTLGDNACLANDVDCYCVDAVFVGDNATVSQGACLCTATHDIRDPHMKLITAPVRIEDQAWICARAFVMPGVVVGQGAVAGACALVTKSVLPWTIVGGNPAKAIGSRQLG